MPIFLPVTVFWQSPPSPGALRNRLVRKLQFLLRFGTIGNAGQLPECDWHPTAGQLSEPYPDPYAFLATDPFLLSLTWATVRVLEASTLKPLRMIRTAVDPDWEIDSIETSPVGHLEIITSGGHERSHVFVYDLDAGSLLLRWDPPPNTSRSLSWRPDGTRFAIAVSRPCGHVGEVDIFATSSWSQIKTLKTKNSDSLAFSNERLYAVQSGSCKGLFAGRQLGIDRTVRCPGMETS
jgi:hypothetical protein